jgi:hypothetical protein
MTWRWLAWVLLLLALLFVTVGEIIRPATDFCQLYIFGKKCKGEAKLADCLPF